MTSQTPRIIETAYHSELRTIILAASDVAQLVTALADKCRDLASILGTHMEERENQLVKVILLSSSMCTVHMDTLEQMDDQEICMSEVLVNICC